MKHKIILFCTGFIQVILVSINTWQIAHEKYVGIAIVGFLISFVWTFNVKHIAFGTLSDRLWYSFGAMVGSIGGLIVAKIIY